MLTTQHNLDVYSDLFKHPMNLKSLIGGVVVAVAAFLPILIALIAIRVLTGC